MTLTAILLFATWETFLSALPYGIKYSIVAVVACFVAIVLDEEVKGKRTVPRSAIRRMFLSVAFTWGLTWFGTVKFGFTYDTNFIVAALVGLCIQFVAPWVQEEGFGLFKRIFKSTK